MILGYHSPMPPAPTGVADYAAQLHAALSRHIDVRLDAASADRHLYHIGNNHLHRPMYLRAIRNPDAVLLHDANLHHFYLGALSREAYIDEFRSQYGEWYRGYAESLWTERARSAGDPRYYQHPMLGRITRAARIVIVHNDAAAEIVRRHASNARIEIIPHYFEAPPPVSAADVAELRASLGLRGCDTLFAVFGHLRESKRIGPILRAFAAARRCVPSIRLLLAGRFVSTDYERSIDAGQPGVIRVPYLPASDFRRHAAAADVCINLRYPSCGESSGIATRLMGIGKALLVTSGVEHAAMPPGTHIPIEAGAGEEHALAEWMGLLASEKRLAVQIGERAASHIREFHGIGRIAEKFVEILAR